MTELGQVCPEIWANHSMIWLRHKNLLFVLSERKKRKGNTLEINFDAYLFLLVLTVINALMIVNCDAYLELPNGKYHGIENSLNLT